MVKENEHGFWGIDRVLCLDQDSVFGCEFICKKIYIYSEFELLICALLCMYIIPKLNKRFLFS